jgi:RimJ/RimL family protein N-acetyltransferase
LTEATRASLDHAATAIALQPIIAETQDANAPSHRLLEQLDMTARVTLIRFWVLQVIYEMPLGASPIEAFG